MSRTKKHNSNRGIALLLSWILTIILSFKMKCCNLAMKHVGRKVLTLRN